MISYYRAFLKYSQIFVGNREIYIHRLYLVGGLA